MTQHTKTAVLPQPSDREAKAIEGALGGQPPTQIDKTIQKIEELLSPSGASLVYAGYPFDPFA